MSGRSAHDSVKLRETSTDVPVHLCRHYIRRDASHQQQAWLGEIAHHGIDAERLERAVSAVSRRA
jgi:hypothetical protein